MAWRLRLLRTGRDAVLD